MTPKKILFLAILFITIALVTILTFDVSRCWLYLQAKDFINLESNTFRNVMLVIAAIITTIFAWWRATIADKQVKISEQGLNIDRLQKSAEMLGHTELETRQAGVIILFELARQNPKDYLVTAERLLSSFIRAQSGKTLKTNIGIEDFETEKFSRRSALDSIAAIKAISDLNHLKHQDAELPIVKTNIRHVNLIGINLNERDLSDMDLTGVDFSFSDLKNVKFKNSNLTRAVLDKAKNVTYSQLSKAKNVDSDFLDELRLKEEAEENADPKD